MFYLSDGASSCRCGLSVLPADRITACAGGRPSAGLTLHQMLVVPAVMDSEALDAHGQVIHSEPLRIASYTAGPPCRALARPA